MFCSYDEGAGLSNYALDLTERRCEDWVLDGPAWGGRGFRVVAAVTAAGYKETVLIPKPYNLRPALAPDP